jgi:hypothetical protein
MTDAYGVAVRELNGFLFDGVIPERLRDDR